MQPQSSEHSWNPTIMCFDNSWWIAFTFPSFWGCQWHSLKQKLYLSCSNTPLVLSRLRKFFQLISWNLKLDPRKTSLLGSGPLPGLPFSQVVWKEIVGFITRKPRAWDSQPYELFWKHLKPLGTHIFLRNVVPMDFQGIRVHSRPRVAGHE